MRGGASREAHRRTVQTAGRTAVFSGLTVAAAMAALIVMPQRFLYSMAVAGASVALLSAVIAILVVPSLLALLGTRIDALSIRRGPAVSDTSDGWYRLARGVMRRPVAVALASSALLLAAAVAAALDDPDRPQRRSGAARPALLRRLPLPRGALPARRHRGGHGHRRRRYSPRPSSPPSSAASKRSTASSAAPPSSPPRAQVAYANFALAGPALSGDSQDSVRRDPRPRSAHGRGDARLRQHRRLHRPEAEPGRPRAAGRGDHRAHHPDPALPAHRLGPAAAEDAADEHADARRHARHPRPRLPGGLARRRRSTTPARPRSR